MVSKFHFCTRGNRSNADTMTTARSPITDAQVKCLVDEWKAFRFTSLHQITNCPQAVGSHTDAMQRSHCLPHTVSAFRWNVRRNLSTTRWRNGREKKIVLFRDLFNVLTTIAEQAKSSKEFSIETENILGKINYFEISLTLIARIEYTFPAMPRRTKPGKRKWKSIAFNLQFKFVSDKNRLHFHAQQNFTCETCRLIYILLLNFY